MLAQCILAEYLGGKHTHIYMGTGSIYIHANRRCAQDSHMCIYIYVLGASGLLPPHPMVMVHLVMPPLPRGMWDGPWECPQYPPRKGPTHGSVPAPPPVGCGVDVHMGRGMHICMHACMHSYVGACMP